MEISIGRIARQDLPFAGCVRRDTPCSNTENIAAGDRSDFADLADAGTGNDDDSEVIA